MRRTLLLGSLLFTSLSLACSTGGNTGTSSGGGSSSSTGGTAAAGINGCTTYTDQSSSAAPTINFGGSLGLAYSPNCASIAAGQSVTFVGEFSVHPLTPGISPTLSEDAGTVTNPITTPGADAGSATFAFPSPGIYPFYCNQHYTKGMYGAIQVK